MEPSTIFFILAALCLCIGIFKVASSYKKENSNLEGRVKNLQTGKFSTDMNRVAAWNERKPSEQRAKLASQLANEASAVAGLGKAQTNVLEAQHTLSKAPARLAEARKQEKALHKNKIAIVNKATQRRVSPETLEQQKLEKHKTDELIRLKEAESRIEIGKHQELARIEVQKDYDIRMNQLKAVLALKTFPYMKLKKARKYFKGLLLEDAMVANDKSMPVSAKVEYRMLLQETIVVYRRAYGRGLGFLQSDNGGNLGQPDGFTQLGSGVKDID